MLPDRWQLYRLTGAILKINLKELSSFNQRLPSAIIHALGERGERQLLMSQPDQPRRSLRRDFELIEPGEPLTAVDDREAEIGVVRLCSLRQRSRHLLLGLQTSWLVDGKTALRYGGCRLLVFYAWGNAKLGDIGSSSRRQLMRLEWEGVNIEGAFEASSAAHPHWQVDRWLTGLERATAAAARRLRQADSTKNFGEVFDAQDEELDMRWMRSVHLAAAATWADTPWANQDTSAHARPPRDLEQLLNWLGSATRYIKEQFAAALEGS